MIVIMDSDSDSELISSPDGVVKVVRLRAEKSTLEYAIQHTYPVEISCYASVVAPPSVNNTQDVSSTTSLPVRPHHNASAAARERIRDQTITEQDEPEVEW